MASNGRSSERSESLLLLNETSKKRFLQKILDPAPANVSQFPSKQSETMAVRFGANSDFRDPSGDLENLELRKEERICFFGSLKLSVIECTVECMGYVLSQDDNLTVTIHSPKWGAAMSIAGTKKTSRASRRARHRRLFTSVYLARSFSSSPLSFLQSSISLTQRT